MYTQAKGWMCVVGEGGGGWMLYATQPIYLQNNVHCFNSKIRYMYTLKAGERS